MKFLVAHAPCNQIVTEIRSKNGDPLKLIPGQIVDLSPEAARVVMEVYPGRISPAAEAPAKTAKEEKDEKKEEASDEKKAEKGHTPGGAPAKVTKEG